MEYLRGVKLERDYYHTQGIAARNKLWWERTIAPLLEARVRSAHSQPPILMIYGAGHNSGPFSITDLIKEKGFEVRHLTQK